MLEHLFAHYDMVLMPTAGGIIPDASPALPDGLSGLVSKLVSWGKGGVMFLGVLGLLGSAAQMAIGRRRSHQMAVDGAVGVGWVTAGIAVCSVAVTIVGAIGMVTSGTGH